MVTGAEGRAVAGQRGETDAAQALGMAFDVRLGGVRRQRPLPAGAGGQRLGAALEQALVGPVGDGGIVEGV
ncbi:hypothetical protein D3C81_2138290 [compost metagenome]